MKKYITILLFIFICGITTVLICCKENDRADTADTISENQIKEAVQTFANLIDSQEVQEFGLKSLAELKSLKGGKQFRQYMIGLDDIKKYKQGEDVSKIIKEYSSIEVSLVNDTGKIRTSVQFVKNKGKWEASGWGSTPELIIVRNAQATLADSDINKGKLIRIPALYTNFIAVSSAAGLEFIVLEDNNELNFKKGEKVTSSDAILKLVPLAIKHPGMPN